jgi:hypothetical protein
MRYRTNADALMAKDARAAPWSPRRRQAVALAVNVFREHGCVPGEATTMELEARSPTVTHTVTLGRVPDWLESSGKSPRDKQLKERLNALTAL